MKLFCSFPHITEERFKIIKLLIDKEPNVLYESRESDDKYGVELRQIDRTVMDYLMKNYTKAENKSSKVGKCLIFLIAYLKQKASKNKTVSKG